MRTWASVNLLGASSIITMRLVSLLTNPLIKQNNCYCPRQDVSGFNFVSEPWFLPSLDHRSNLSRRLLARSSSKSEELLPPSSMMRI